MTSPDAPLPTSSGLQLTVLPSITVSGAVTVHEPVYAVSAVPAGTPVFDGPGRHHRTDPAIRHVCRLSRTPGRRDRDSPGARGGGGVGVGGRVGRAPVERVRAVGEARVGLRRGACAPGAARRGGTRTRRARLGGGEREARRRAGRRCRSGRCDRGVGRRGVDGDADVRWPGGVGVAGRVGGAHVERVGAVGEAGSPSARCRRSRRRRRGGTANVEPDSRRGEREARRPRSVTVPLGPASRGCRAPSCRPAPSRDGPRPRGRGRVGVAGRVGGAHVERVRAVGEPGVGLRRGAGRSRRRRRGGIGTSSPISVEVNEKPADVLVTVPLGPAVIDVLGAVVSSGGDRRRSTSATPGTASVLSAASVARTLNVCEPFARPE